MSNVNAMSSGRNCGTDCYAYDGSSFVQKPSEMFVCGDHLVDPNSDPHTGQYTGAVAILSLEGEIQMYMTLGGSNTKGTDQDKCMGISFNEDTNNVGVLVQGKMAQLRAG